MTMAEAAIVPIRESANQSSVTKALSILNVFEDAGVLGVSEVARRAGLAKTTAYRLLSSLESQGWVERRDASYCLGRRLFELGNQVSWCRPRSLRDTALPALCDLFTATRRTVHLGVLDGLDVLVLDKLQSRERPWSATRVGGRVPVRTTALGKALIAHGDRSQLDAVLGDDCYPRTPYSITSAVVFEHELQAVRRSGVAFDREESTLGLASVAAAIVVRGKAIGAVSLTGSSTAFDPEQFAGKVAQAARLIAAEMQRR